MDDESELVHEVTVDGYAAIRVYETAGGKRVVVTTAPGQSTLQEQVVLSFLQMARDVIGRA